MVLTKNDTGTGTGTDAGFNAGRCLWSDSVCVDAPTHYISHETADGTEAAVYCLRHYVLTLASLCELHLPSCEGDFPGHVAGHGEL